MKNNNFFRKPGDLGYDNDSTDGRDRDEEKTDKVIAPPKVG